MNCPRCQNEEIKVVDSRSHEQTIRRRRECLGCGERFNTFERFEIRFPAVVKRDKSRESYERHKIIDGLRLACRKRPIPTHKIEKAADEIESLIVHRFSDEVFSEDIGGMVLTKLQELDMVAYLRFASVYLEVDTPNDIIELLSPWLSESDGLVK